MKVSSLENEFNYEEDKKVLKQKNLTESVKIINDDRTNPIYYSTSIYDIINSLNNVVAYRVSYNPTNKTFIYADMDRWVHPMMLLQALNQGLFPNIASFTQLKNSNQAFDFGITNKEQGVEQFYNDSYTVRRDYNGFTIMTRPDQDIFEKTDIQDLISKVK